MAATLYTIPEYDSKTMKILDGQDNLSDIKSCLSFVKPAFFFLEKPNENGYNQHIHLRIKCIHKLCKVVLKPILLKMSVFAS